MPLTVQQPPAEIRLCDENQRQSIVLTQYDSFTYTERWGSGDSFVLTMKRTADHADDFRKEGLLIVPADQTHDYYRVLYIKQIKVSEDEVVVSGGDYLWELFASRIVHYGTGMATGYDDFDGIAEEAARHYINKNILEASNPARGDPFVVLESERVTPLGEDVSIVGRLQFVDYAMESVCTQGDINIYGALVEDDTLPRGWYIEARFEVPTDHTQDDDNPNDWVVLSEEYGNAVVTEFIDNVPESTVVSVWGYGSGTTRAQVQVGDDTLSGCSRREAFIDASDCVSTRRMTRRGEEYLKKQSLKTSVGMRLTNTDMYNRDFTLGDYVTCDMGIYGAYNLQVTEVKTEYTEEGTSISVTVGAEFNGVMTILRNAIEGIPIRRQ